MVVFFDELVKTFQFYLDANNTVYSLINAKQTATSDSPMGEKTRIIIADPTKKVKQFNTKVGDI
jgi:hypothetical protein